MHLKNLFIKDRAETNWYFSYFEYHFLKLLWVFQILAKICNRLHYIFPL